MTKTLTPKKGRASVTGSEVLVNVLLDRSGSMSVCRDTTIDGYNEYLKGLRADKETKYCVSLTQFDATGFTPELTVCYIDKPLEKVPDLTAETYKPRGNTPLYDAIGEVLRRVADKANRRPVLNVILTDGLENASREFTQQSIKAVITEKEKAGHTFVFIGANIDSYAVGQSIGVAAKNVANYSAGNEVRTFSALAAASANYASARRASLSARQLQSEAFLSDAQRSAMLNPSPSKPSGGTAGRFPRPQKRDWAVKTQR